jgi:predicted DNA-binding protein (MmcQ/YjbR family)
MRTVPMGANHYAKALEKLRSVCFALPEVREVEAWGHPTFRAGKKLFAAIGQETGKVTLGLRVGHDRQDELLKDDRFYPTPYAARLGWVSLWIDGQTDWKEVGRLVREAYRSVALRRMLKVLDEAGDASTERTMPSAKAPRERRDKRNMN